MATSDLVNCVICKQNKVVYVDDVLLICDGCLKPTQNDFESVILKNQKYDPEPECSFCEYIVNPDPNCLWNPCRATTQQDMVYSCYQSKSSTSHCIICVDCYDLLVPKNKEIKAQDTCLRQSIFYVSI